MTRLRVHEAEEGGLVAAAVAAFPVVVEAEASRAAVRPRAAVYRPVRGEHRPGPARGAPGARPRRDRRSAPRRRPLPRIGRARSNPGPSNALNRIKPLPRIGRAHSNPGPSNALNRIKPLPRIGQRLSSSVRRRPRSAARPVPTPGARASRRGPSGRVSAKTP
jgi:hypothetical protein